MSGEAVGVVAVPAIPLLICGAAIYGMASVVKTLAEQEKASREAQRLRIEKEAAQITLEANKYREIELKEMEERRKKFKEIQDRKEKEEALERKKKEEAEKIEWISKNFSMSNLDGIIQNLNIDLQRVINDLENVKNAGNRKVLKNTAEELSAKLKSASNDNIWDIKKGVENFRGRVTRIKQYGFDPEEKEKLINQIIKKIETDIDALPRSYLHFIANDINEIQQSIGEIKGKLAGNYTFYESILKGIKLRTKETISAAKKKFEEHEKLKKSMEGEIKELFMRLASPVIKDEKRVAAFKREITNLYAHDLAFAQKEIRRLSDEITAFYKEYLELPRLDGERNHILNGVRETLEEMGYEAIPVQSSEKEQGGGKYKCIEMRIPGGEAVRIALGNDKQFTTKVFHPKDVLGASYDAFRAQEEKFCSDLPKFREKLKQKGMVLNIETEEKIDDSELEQLLETEEQRIEGLKEGRLD